MKPNFLNLTLPLKQDAASQAAIQQFLKDFPTKHAPGVVQVLKESRMVHYCRFVNIRDKYLQVLTEFDTDIRVYNKYFADHLGAFFQLLFSVVEGAPAVSLAQDPDTVNEFINRHNLPSLPGSTFAAYPELTVSEIQQKFGIP